MENKKIILHLIKSANPAGGGAQKILNGIKDNSYHEHIIIFTKKNNPNINAMSTPPLLVPLKLIKTLITKNIAAVVIHDRSYLLLHYIVKALKKKTVFLCHNIFQNKNSIFRLLKNINYISVSESAERNLLSSGVPQNNITVIRNGIITPSYANNFSDFSRAAQYIFNPKQTQNIKILYVGRLSTEKGVYNLIEALNLEPLKYKNIELVLIGPLNAKFKSHYDSLDNQIKSKISLLGNIDKPFESIHNHHADLIVIPSLYEGFGLVMAEALSAGLKIVASDIPPFREISNSPTITFSKPNCANDLALMIDKSLASRPSIEDSWKESRRVTAQFSQKKMYENYDSYFAEI